MTITQKSPEITMKDLKAEDPRWCTGCGDYTILVGMRKFMVARQLLPKDTVNISGIGCSGRIPHYLNTYGLHGIHGRAVPLATGLTLVRPELKLFIHSGDGDSLSIGGNHLMHGIHKNLNCVYLLFDNQIYGLTKQQTSPTSQKGLITQTQPTGSEIEPINPVQFALGLGATFVASTAEWLGGHFLETVEKAFDHEGFSFVHIAQRCPKYNPDAWDYKSMEWMTFLESENGISAPKKGDTIKKETTNTSSIEQAREHANHVPNRFGLFYQTKKVTYNTTIKSQLDNAKKKDKNKLLDRFSI